MDIAKYLKNLRIFMAGGEHALKALIVLDLGTLKEQLGLGGNEILDGMLLVTPEKAFFFCGFRSYKALSGIVKKADGINLVEWTGKCVTQQEKLMFLRNFLSDGDLLGIHKTNSFDVTPILDLARGLRQEKNITFMVVERIPLAD